MKIFYWAKFEREFRKLPREIQYLAKQKEKLFRKDCFDTRLKTHKLHGELSGYWAFSVNHQYRIIFKCASTQIINFYSIGNHDIYQ